MPSAFTSSSDAFESRRDAFESEYFHNKDVQLVEKLKGVFNRKLDREALRKATGISNDEVIDRLLAVNAKGELLLAFRLYPLVEMAWADGVADQKECDAVIAAAMKMGVGPNSEALSALKAWLKRGPAPDGRVAWYAFAAELRKTLNPQELEKFRQDLIEGAKAVAKASGGIMGVMFEISATEHAVLNKISEALSSAKRQ